MLKPEFTDFVEIDELKIRRGNLEFSFSTCNNKPQLCAYHPDAGNKYVICFFDKGKEGYDMRTIGARPFHEDHVNPDEFMKMAKFAMAILAQLHELDDE